MVLFKIFVAIILTKLQHFESLVSVKKTYTLMPQVQTERKSLRIRENFT